MKSQRSRIKRRPGVGARRTRGQGFALIEVLVSLAVLAIGLLAVLTGVLASLDLQKDSERRLRAGLLLQEKLTEISVAPPEEASLQGVSSDGMFTWSITSEPWYGLPPAPDGTFSLADSLAGELSAVSVVVGWETVRGGRSVRATQLVRVGPGEGSTP